MHIVMDFYFIFLYCTVPLLVMSLAKCAGLKPLKISIPMIFVWFYLLFAYVGTLPLYFKWFDYRVNAGVTDQQIIFRVFLYSAFSLVCIMLGFLTVKFSSFRIFNTGNVRNSLFKIELVVIVVISILCGFVLLLYIRQIPNIAIKAALSGATQDARILRSVMSGAYSSVEHYWRYALFFHTVLPFVVFILFSHALIKRSFKAYILFFIVFACTFFAAVMALHKAPAIRLFIGLGITYLLTKRSGNVSKNFIASLGLVCLTMLIGMYMVFFGVDTLSDASKKVFSRFVSGQIHPAYYYLEMFPFHTDFLYGRSFPNPKNILPFDHYPITIEVMKYAFPEKQITGSAPTVFWAECYANFGPIITFVASYFVGIYVFSIGAIVSRLPASPTQIGLTTWVGLHLAKLSFTSLSNFLLDTRILTIITIAIGILILRGHGSLKIIRKQPVR